MHLGALIPLYESAEDPAALADFAQAAEDLGYTSLSVFDNVLALDLTHRPDWDDPANLPPYHEPLVMFAYVAALTRRVELISEVIVLPQRQTALVAKQAAELDVLSNGRLRLGVGAGYIKPLFEAMNAEFDTRGARMDEQVAVLRALWTQDVVTFHGRWHHIDEMRLHPLPKQRPIPIWFGGHADAVLRRVVAVGDGWAPLWTVDSNEEARQLIERLHTYAQEAGRDPRTIGIATGMGLMGTTPDDWRHTLEAWRALGATEFHVATFLGPDAPMGRAPGTGSVQSHIDLIRQFKEVADQVLRQ
jgi:probable F420-dependent oxidoreductase